MIILDFLVIGMLAVLCVVLLCAWASALEDVDYWRRAFEAEAETRRRIQDECEERHVPTPPTPAENARRYSKPERTW